MRKAPRGRTIHGHTAVAGVAQDDRAQGIFAPGRASARVAGVRCSPPSAWPATSGASSGGGCGPASPRLRTAMREAEKVEGSRFPLTTISPLSSRIATELSDSRFVGVPWQFSARLHPLSSRTGTLSSSRAEILPRRTPRANLRARGYASTSPVTQRRAVTETEKYSRGKTIRVLRPRARVRS